jgi:hypothetical protein
MQKHREANGAEEVRVTLPNGGALMEAQRAATENATRIANAACHYALSVNKAWIELWGNRLNEYLELPKRFVNAQSDFVEQAVDHYQDSLQKLGDLATKATQHAQSAVKETQAAGERVARQFQSDFKNLARGNGQGGNEEHREAAQ